MRKGFSIIELIISITLISFILLFLSGITIYNLKAQRRLNNLKIAKELAFNKITYLNSLPYESDELKEGEHKPETYENKFVLRYIVKEKEEIKGLKWIELTVYILPEKDSLKFSYFIPEIKYEKIYTK